MQYLWMLIVVFLIVGCGKNRPMEGSWEAGMWPARLIVIEGFSEQEKSAVLQAIDSMNRGAGKTLINTSNVGTGYPISIHKVAVDPAKQNRAGLALVENDKCTVSLSVLVFSGEHREKLGPVVEHELGHCAGLQHDPVQGEVMFRSSEALSFYRPEAFSRFYSRVLQSVGL